MGVALTLHVRAVRQGTATGADHAPGPPSHSSSSVCLNDPVREAAKWLQAAFRWSSICKTAPGAPRFDAGKGDAALAHLKEHLSWRVRRGCDTCAGCGQTRGEDTPMLTCSGCRVARFAVQITQKDGFAKSRIDSCSAELVAFLQR